MRIAVWLLLLLSTSVFANVTNSIVAAKVRQSGTLLCGIVGTPEDWDKTDLHGPLTAFDAEFCKAVAIAVTGSPTSANVKVFPSELELEEALSKHIVDLAFGVTPNPTAMWHWRIAFGPTIFYDAQGFLVRGDVSVDSLAGLAGRNVCVIEGTDNEKVLLARTVGRGIAITPMPFQEEGEMDDGLAVRHCDAISAYLSRLAQIKTAYPRQLGHDSILRDVLTLAPVAAAYRSGDSQWKMIVDWTIYALIQAEASGVTRANVTTLRGSEDPMVQRLLGVDWATSRALGLPAKDWSAQVIAGVGNYAEIYDRTAGMKSSLQMPRGLNALWVDGGLIHPLPMQ